MDPVLKLGIFENVVSIYIYMLLISPLIITDIYHTHILLIISAVSDHLISRAQLCSVQKTLSLFTWIIYFKTVRYTCTRHRINYLCCKKHYTCICIHFWQWWILLVSEYDFTWRWILPVSEDEFYLCQKMNYTCVWRWFLPVSEDEFYLCLKMIFTCVWRWILLVSEDDIYLCMKMIFTCVWRWILLVPEDEFYLCLKMI